MRSTVDIALIGAGSGAFVAVATMYTSLVAPSRREKRRADDAGVARKKAHDDVLDGIPAEPGMHPGVPAIVLRVSALEGITAASTEEVKENTAAVMEMSLRQNQANGTMVRVEARLNELTNVLVAIIPDLAVSVDPRAASRSGQVAPPAPA